MRFTANTRGYLKCKISPLFTWLGGCIVTNFSYPWCSTIHYQRSNWHNKWWGNIWSSFFFCSKFTIAQNYTLFFHQFKLPKVKFSDWEVILAIAVSKRCTQDLPVVNTRGSSTGFSFAHQCFPKNTAIADFGVPFLINFLLLRHF